MQPAYLDLVNFIASGTTPRDVVNYRPSKDAQQRASELIEKDRAGTLTGDEKAELDHYVELEHIMRMAKARAREILAGHR